MIKAFIKSATRSRLMARRFAEAAKKDADHSKAHQEQEQQKEEAEQHEEEFDYDDYEAQQKPSIFRKIFRVVAGTAFSVLALNTYYIYADEANEKVSSGRLGYSSHFYSFPLFLKRKAINGYNFITKPPTDKFLPDQPPIKPAMLNKTLVMSFEGTLYSKDFEAGKGIVLHLRPDYQKFIEEMSKLYEVVIYSEEDSQFLAEVTSTIDPFQKYFPWVFGREYFIKDDNKYIKDLNLLNRDMKKVVVVDFTKEVYKAEPENLILLKKYEGNENEDSLKYLSILLNHLANPSVKDVRKEIKKYGGVECFDNYKKEVQERAEKLRKSRRFFTQDNKRKI